MTQYEHTINAKVTIRITRDSDNIEKDLDELERIIDGALRQNYYRNVEIDLSNYTAERFDNR